VSTEGKIVNKAELASLFGVSITAVDKWLGRGCPYLEKGGPSKGYKFDTAAVAEWRSEEAAEQAVELSDPGTDPAIRKLSAEASLAELKLAREEGSLVPIADVERGWSMLIAACRSRLLAVPVKCAAMARAAESTEAARALIEKAITEALNELGAIEDSQQTTAESQASAEAESEPVGGRETEIEPRSIG
jgi:terminase small subunit / prophage DNA-packing protein